MQVDAEKCSNAFARDGFITIRGVFEQELIAITYTRAMDNYKEVMSIIESRSLSLGVGVKNCFKEIVQRQPLRFEMPFKMDSPDFDFVVQHPTIARTVAAILGDNFCVINRSLVVSSPGCSDQSWHSDGPHLSTGTHLPCHCLNVFVPLIDVDVANGPTEFRPESHYYTRDLTKMMLVAKIKKQLKDLQAPCLTTGDVLLFDYRVLHRGTANRSSKPRPILVFTCAKPKFSDMLNFPPYSVYDSKESIINDDPVALKPSVSSAVATTTTTAAVMAPPLADDATVFSLATDLAVSAAHKAAAHIHSNMLAERESNTTGPCSVTSTSTAASTAAVAAETTTTSTQRACFGAGCYWGTENFFFHHFNKLENNGGEIISGAVGFMGPESAPENPSYEDVCTGSTGHVEVYDCEYSGGIAFYEKMVRYFFQFHDPTVLNTQGNDKGTQYASVIYYYNEQQAEVARKVIKELQLCLDNLFLRPYLQNEVRTDVRPATVFFAAHAEHQEYLMNNPNGYCNHRIRFKQWPKQYHK